MVKTLILESYFGKNDKLIKCEEYLTDLKNMMKKGKNPNKSNKLREIEKLFEELFNIKNVNILITPDEKNLYAGVMSFIDFNSFKDMDLEYYEVIKTKEGYKFKDKVKKELVLHLSSRLIKESSEEKIISAILHEFGHQFFYLRRMLDLKNYFRASIYPLSGLYRLLNYTKQLFKIVKIKKDGGDIKYKILKNIITAIIRDFYRVLFFTISLISPKKAVTLEKKIKVNDLTYKSLSKITMINKKISDFFPHIKKINDIKNNIFNSSIGDNVINLAFNFLDKDYDQERFSDSFATMYGYGFSLGSLLTDFKKNKNANNKVFLNYLSLYEMQLDLFFYFFEPHPTTYKRILLIKKKLEHELTSNKEISIEQKKDIKKQLELINKMINSGSLEIENLKKVHQFLKLGDLKNKIMSNASDEQIINL
ncbi:hypothetical protein PBI_PBS1_241 [Bacillus phage PBS1]|uniref:Uncharacterized protein n=1 Tax=Bacillus phage PBS1 TaxID=2884423 RepID=A0A223LDM9_BPPB1|nr:hypothetical protein FK780_gp206 [Bacillus phage PBS1]ASU00063.1 hypothetical protein PBI_PBS1_241 [Bacillus phage PBS1]BDE75427.1 hypothetical protein [Bacillus phage PBS1]